MWLDQAVKWLLPREEHFFDLLERGAQIALKSSAILVECCNATTAEERAEIIARITDEEHVGDKVIHEVYDALNRTFVTPMDRSDIYALATDLENITDCVHGTVMQISVHAIEEFPPGSRELAEKVNLACVEIDAAVKLLRGMKQLDVLRTHCKKITQLEHDGDQVFRSTVAEMFKHEKDAIRLLKNKEFLEGLEWTLDACDDVGNALETLVIKNG
jgi:uncharacterized protein Yka (UPF0111/DUF47 family)